MKRTINVLIVESSPAAAESLIIFLCERGYPSVSSLARTADQFRAALPAKKWDLLVAASPLAPFGGIEAFTLLKENGFSLPCILIVDGALPDETAAYLLRHGVNDIIPRGRLDLLPAAVESALSDKTTRERIARAETVLETTEQRLDLLMQSAPALLFTAAPGGRRLWASANSRDVTGFLAAELMDPAFNWGARVHPDDQERFQKAWAVGEGGAPVMIEYRWKHKDGADVWFLERAHRRRDPRGKETILGVAVDVGWRKAAEEERARAERLEALGRFVSSTANRFNNILAEVQGRHDLLAEEPGLTPKVKDTLAAIGGGIQKAARLVDNLLALTSRQMMTPAEVAVDKTLATLRPVLEDLLGLRIAVTLALDAPQAVIRADPRQLEHLFFQLADNARDAMPNGGAFTIATRLTSSPGAEPELRIEVTDTGSGMDDEAKAKLFQPFFTTKPNGRGTGLGLSAVRHIMESSGGRVEVSSQLGRGTVFAFHFPALKPEVAAEMPLVIPPKHGASDHFILVVDDEPGLLEVYARVIERAGYLCLKAASGEQALAMIRHHGNAVVCLLTDVMMPGMNGVALASKVKEFRPSLPIVFMSGYAEPSLVSSEILAQGSPLLIKPFRGDTLIKLLQSLIGLPVAARKAS